MFPRIVYAVCYLNTAGFGAAPRAFESLSLWDLLFYQDDAWRHHIRDKTDVYSVSTWTSNLESIKGLLTEIAADDEAVYKGQPAKILGSINLDNTLTETPFPGTTFRLIRDFKKRFNNRIFRGICAGCSHKEVIFKYATNCDAVSRNFHCRLERRDGYCPLLREEDPLVKEYVISKIFQTTGICPAVLVLSSPKSLLVPEFMGGKKFPKLNFQMLKNPKWRRRCFNEKYHVDPTVRLIVEEKMGKNIKQYYQENLVGYFGSLTVPKIIDSILLFIRIIQAIQIFHDNGFVHGDIHAGNIVVRKNKREDKSDWDVVLIDFGYSKFFPVEFGTPEKLETDVYRDLNPALLSPFQIRGYRVGRRDDIFRAYEILVNFLTNFTYSKYASHRKLREIIFTGNGSEEYQGIDGFLYDAMIRSRKPFDRDDFNEIDTILEYMLEYVRGESSDLDHPDSRPNYEWIIGWSRKLIKILIPYSV